MPPGTRQSPRPRSRPKPAARGASTGRQPTAPRAEPREWPSRAYPVAISRQTTSLRRPRGVAQKVEIHERYAVEATAQSHHDPAAGAGPRRDLVRAARLAPPVAQRRRPLRRNGARDVRHRRLDHAALQRLQILREAAAANLGERADVRVVRRRRMAGAALHRADGLRRRAADRLHRRARVQYGDRRVRRDRAGVLAVLEPDGPLQHARHGPVVLDGADAVRAAARAAPQPVDVVRARLDVGVLGVDGAGGTVQGAGRRDPAGRRAGALHADRARLGAVEAAASDRRPDRVLRDRHAVVRAGAAAQPGIPELLLHRPAVQALPDARAEPPRPVLLLRAGADRGLSAVALGDAAKRAPRVARAAPAERLRAGDADAGVDRLHLPVLQRIAFEAAVLHAADRPADRAC